MSQPCTSDESDFQRRLFAWPQAGCTFLFCSVTCFQLPFGPAHTSGGVVKELRTAADVRPSFEMETDGPQVPAVTCSSPRKSDSIFLLAGSSTMIDESPPINSPAVICPSLVQASQLAEALRAGVRLCGLPPSRGMTIMFPPTEPKSLINPSMNAMEFPSGDHAGKLICSSGL